MKTYIPEFYIDRYIRRDKTKYVTGGKGRHYALKQYQVKDMSGGLVYVDGNSTMTTVLRKETAEIFGSMTIHRVRVISLCNLPIMISLPGY